MLLQAPADSDSEKMSGFAVSAAATTSEMHREIELQGLWNETLLLVESKVCRCERISSRGRAFDFQFIVEL